MRFRSWLFAALTVGSVALIAIRIGNRRIPQVAARHVAEVQDKYIRIFQRPVVCAPGFSAEDVARRATALVAAFVDPDGSRSFRG